MRCVWWVVCGAWWRVGFVIFIALYFILFIFTYFISYFPHFPRIFSSTQRRVGRLGPKPKPVRGLEIVPACSRSGWPRHSKQQIWPLAGQTRKRLAPPRWDTNSALSTFCGSTELRPGAGPVRLRRVQVLKHLRNRASSHRLPRATSWHPVAGLKPWLRKLLQRDEEAVA